MRRLRKELTGFANRKEIILKLRKESSKTDTETDRMNTNKRQTERWTETQIKYLEKKSIKADAETDKMKTNKRQTDRWT
jgi:hypothetical protein